MSLNLCLCICIYTWVACVRLCVPVSVQAPWCVSVHLCAHAPKQQLLSVSLPRSYLLTSLVQPLMISPKRSTAPKLASIDLAALEVTGVMQGQLAGPSPQNWLLHLPGLPGPNLIPQEEETSG